MSQNPDGSFTVTLADVYAEVRKLSDQVSAMAPQAGTIEDHETRIRTVESTVNTVRASLDAVDRLKRLIYIVGSTVGGTAVADLVARIK